MLLSPTERPGRDGHIISMAITCQKEHDTGGSVPSSSVLGSFWLSFLIHFPLISYIPALSLSPSYLGRGRSYQKPSKVPPQPFVQQAQPGSVSPFTSGGHGAQAQTGLVNGHLAMGRLVKPAQPRSGQGQPRQPWDLPQPNTSPQWWQI